MSVDLGGLVTEGHRSDLVDLDLRPTLDVVRVLQAADAEVAPAVAAAAGAVAAAVDAVVARLSRGGRLLYVGAGTAGRLGALDAVECGPTFGTAPGQVAAVVAGGEAALVTACEGVEDDAAAGADDLDARGVSAADAVVGISASGRTPYVLGAVAHARRVGALTVGLACNPGAELNAVVDHAIEVVVGPEVITGSTRLKAGTAQKMVLNTISTAAMVGLGRSFGNLMVAAATGSDKLRDRGRRTVQLATGRSAADALAALDGCGGDVRAAVVALLAGVGADEARRRLAAAGGVVRRALEGGIGGTR